MNIDIDAAGQRPPITGIPPQLHQDFLKVLADAEKIWRQRQGQYGLTPFHRDPAIILALIQTKLWRLEKDITHEDSALDILVYAAILCMTIREEWCE